MECRHFYVVILIVLSSTELSSADLNNEVRTDSVSSLSFIGVYLKEYAVFKFTDTTLKPIQNITFSYWWKENWKHTPSKTLRHEEVLRSTKKFSAVKLENIQNLTFLCVQVEGSPSEQCRYSKKDILLPTDVRISSTNYNYSLLWNYNFTPLASEVTFNVEIYDELVEDWIEAEDCSLISDHHCDLFWNNFLRNDSSCPETIFLFSISARVQVCLESNQPICGRFVNNLYYDVETSGTITPPNFQVQPQIIDQHLMLTNYPHLVPTSNKSLTCYFDNELTYRILYYNENDDSRKEILQEKTDVSFDMNSISLPLNRTLNYHETMCVEMMIMYDGIPKSKSKKTCIPTTSEKEVKLDFLIPLLGCLISIFILLSCLGYKIRRYYKSLLDFEIPQELKAIKMEIEAKNLVFYVDSLSSPHFDFYREKVDSIISNHSLTMKEKEVAKLSLITDLKVSLKSDSSASNLSLRKTSISSTNKELSKSDATSYVFQMESGELVCASDYQPSHHLADRSSSLHYESQPSSMKPNTSSIQTSSTSIPETLNSSYNCTSFGVSLQEINEETDSNTRLESDDSRSSLMAESFQIPSRTINFDRSSKKFSATDLKGKYFERPSGIIKLSNPTYALSPDNELDSLENFVPIANKSLDSHLSSAKRLGSSKHNSYHPNLYLEDVVNNLEMASDSTKVGSKNVEPIKNTEANSSKIRKSCFPNKSYARKSCSHSPKPCTKNNESKYFSLFKSHGISTFNTGKDMSSNMTSNRHSFEFGEDSVVPSYVVYSRSRKDSHRSADSGLPHDWPSFSDDSITPPQTPTDFYIAENEHHTYGLLQQHHNLSSISSKRNSSKLKLQKRESGHIMCGYETQPLMLKITEDLKVKSNLALNNADDRAEMTGYSVENNDFAYVQVSELKSSHCT